LLVLVCPEHSSFSTDIRPALKHECHTKTAVQLHEYSPKASQNISRISVADLPSFTQKFLQTRSPSFLSIAAKTKHEVEKAFMPVHSAVSRGRLIQ
jgi:hypothetical protein